MSSCFGVIRFECLHEVGNNFLKNREVGKFRTKLEEMNGTLQWRPSSLRFSNSIIDFPTQNFPTTRKLSVGIELQYWEILVKSFFRKSVVESRKKFKSILKYFFTLSCLCFSLNEVCSLAFGSVCVYSCLFHSKIEK